MLKTGNSRWSTPFYYSFIFSVNLKLFQILKIVIIKEGRHRAAPLLQFINPVSCWWVELCSLPAIYLGPDYGGGDEDNAGLLQSIPCVHGYNQCPRPAAGHSRPTPPPETPGHSWASLGQSLAGSLLLSPGSWCLRFCLCLQESIPRSRVSSGGSLVGLMATSSWGLMPYPHRQHPEPLSPWQATADPHLHRRRPNTVLSQSLWGPWVLERTRFVWALWASLAGMGFDAKHEFAPPTVLLGLLLCPWTWGISSEPLQHLPSYWGFSDLGLLITQMLTRTTRKQHISLWTRSDYYRDMILLTTDYYQLLENISLNQIIQ